ncbi:MAG: hypothetical protein H0W07_01755 [Chloroflexi bacterium]|nr:hypothetical protein [Chloroflexota bacterium]
MTDQEATTHPAEPDELRPTPLPPEGLLVDVASDDSFPASDPPSYPAVSASKPTGDDHPDVVPDPTPGPSSRD